MTDDMSSKMMNDKAITIANGRLWLSVYFFFFSRFRIFVKNRKQVEYLQNEFFSFYSIDPREN